MASSKETPPKHHDPSDFVPWRGEYGGPPTGALFFMSTRATLPLLFSSVLAPLTSPYSLFSKIPWAAPSSPPVMSSSLSVPGIPDSLLTSLNRLLGLQSTYASLLTVGVILSTVELALYSFLWRREILPLTGKGGGMDMAVVINAIDVVHLLVFTYLSSRNPTWSPDLFKWTPWFFLVGLGLMAGADHAKYLFRKDEANKDKVNTTGVWGFVRHPNFLGFTIWRIAYGCAAGGWAFGLLLAAVFTFQFSQISLPPLEKYMEKKYGTEWERAKKDVPYKLIPGIL